MSKSPFPPQSFDIEAIAGYDLWASDYDTFDNPMIAMVDWVFDQHPLSVKDCDVLELGCGTGRNLKRIMAEGAASYLGIDGSKEMLAIARSRKTEAKVSWVESDLSKSLSVPPSSFGHVVITLVLEHLCEVQAIICEASKALAVGGKLRILEIHPELIAKGAQAHFWHQGREMRLPSFRHDQDEIKKALHAANLRIDAINEWSAPDELVAKLPKLGKHAGRPLVLEVLASKS